MSLEVSFTLNEEDLDYFRSNMGQAQEQAASASEDDIIKEARAVLDRVDESKAAHFVRDRLKKLEVLINMLDDDEWPLQEQERLDVISALAYFYHAEDMIQDNIPVLGLIDDAIMIELVVRELKHEFEAYEDFCEFRSTESQLRGSDVSREEWLKAKQKELFQRMRGRMNRRYRSSGGAGRLTRFSFLS